jgi:hypothetical protein
MASGFTRRCLIALMLAAPAPLSAGADQILYAWTGFAEPGTAPGNPWGLSGDGSAVTQNDGTPFTLEAIVDDASPDLDGSLNPGFARFPVFSATLTIGGSEADLGSMELRFQDDDPVFAFDDVSFRGPVTRLATTLFFSASVRLPIGTFVLADPPAPDIAPSFEETEPIQFGANGGPVITYPAHAPVTAEVIPEPSSEALLVAGVGALVALRRRASPHAR